MSKEIVKCVITRNVEQLSLDLLLKARNLYIECIQSLT